MTGKRRWLGIMLWGLVGLGLAILIVVSFFLALSAPADRASWWQVFLESLGLAIVLYQLDRIRRALGQNPVIKIGVAGVGDLPLSKIRDMRVSSNVVVNRGYAHFMLVVQNRGRVAARFVKMHLEFLSSGQSRQTVLVPVVEVSEFSDDKKSFTKENNFDFTFVGSSDWVVHPHDSEVFGFHITTVVVKQKEPYELREYPEPGDYDFRCTLWTEGLDHPVSERLTVRVREHLGS